MDITDERFINWMRISPFSKFKKLYGRIEVTLEKGSYSVSIINNSDISKFKGRKSLIFEQQTLIGDSNIFLAILYIVVGFVSIMFSICLLILKSQRKRGLLNKYITYNLKLD